MKHLIGKNILEVVTELPNYDWFMQDSIKITPEKIKTLIFVYYQLKKPRNYEDLYHPIDTTNLSLDDLSFIENEKNIGIGLISKVILENSPDYIGNRFAHIPLIDFDTHDNFNFLDETNLLDLIKTNIKEKLELNRGVILKSSSKRNYHFIGTERLLSEDQFVTFCGLCLTMKYKHNERELVLADSKHIGHSLSPMKYMGELNNWSRYDFQERFSTLRLNPKNSFENYPVVVDILE